MNLTFFKTARDEFNISQGHYIYGRATADARHPSQQLIG